MSAHPIIDELEKAQMKDEVPQLSIGDIVRVSKSIVEGKKTRIQRFEGTIIKMRGANSNASFTVRKVIDGIGVEKTFLLHSPLVPEVVTVKRSKVRRAKLYYLRERLGAKANRLKARQESQAQIEAEAQARLEAKQKKQEEARLAEEAKQAEAAKKAEEAKQAEAAKKAEETAKTDGDNADKVAEKATTTKEEVAKEEPKKDSETAEKKDTAKETSKDKDETK